MKKQLLTVSIFVMSLCSYSQNWEWGYKYGAGSDDACYDMKVDVFGSLLSTGKFAGTIDFNPGPGINNLSTTMNGGGFYLQKSSSTGTFSWAITSENLATGSTSIGTSISTDNSGNIYVGGWYTGTVDFDPSAAVASLTSVANEYNIFICKYTASGAHVWSKGMTGTANKSLGQVSVDLSGNVLLTGQFASGDIDVDPGAGSSVFSSPQNQFQTFVAKWDNSGNFLWGFQQGYSSGAQIKADGSGNIYVAGTFSNTVDFNPGPSVTNLSSNGQGDGYLQKLSPSGALIWVKGFGGVSTDLCRGLDLDASGNCYLTGSFSVTADFDPGPGVFNISSVNNTWDIFVLKLNNNGDFVWAKSPPSAGSSEYGSKIAVNANGNIDVVGRFYETVDFDPNAGVYNLTSAGNSDGFVWELTPLGDFRWARSFSSSQAVEALALAVDMNEGVYVGGTYYVGMGVDPNTAMQNFTSAGGSDMFMVKLTCKSQVHVNQLACQSYTWPENGQTYSSSGDYSTSYTNQAGCDSVINLHLSIGGPNTGTLNVTLCGNFTSPSGNYSWGTSGTYLDTIANYHGCDSVITIQLNTTPFPSTLVSFQDSVLSVSTVGATYAWIDCDNGFSTFPGANAPSFNVTNNGIYAVIVSQNGCTDTSDCFFVNNLTTNQLEKDNILIYPNPTTDKVNVISDMFITNAEILDLNGKLIEQCTSASGIETIDFNHLSEGIYLLKLTHSSNQVSIHRIIKKL